ncbi:MAG TPA: VOC family protein [Hyphomicrobium sp.]|jgi:PhnB protein|nr:VOC family protein [Hyphomicrobium sp.]
MPKVPEGFHTLTPQIAVKNGDKAIAHYKEALGAKELRRMTLPGTDKIMHAALAIGDSKMFLSDVAMQKKNPKGIGSAFYVYVEDVDAAHKRALAAGMSETMAPMDMFWGDRFSAVDDRFGHRWCFAAHVRDMSEKEMIAARDKMFAAGKPGRVARKAAKKAKKAAKKKR